MTLGQARARAEWEATVRAARAATATVTVQRFKQGNGALWPVNRLVNVCVPGIELGQQTPTGPSASKKVVSSVAMLITGVTFAFSREAGSTTTLTLRRADAFTPEPVIRQTEPDTRFHELDGGV